MVRFFSDKSKNNGSTAQGANAGRKLAIESLEAREMLAADMAEISGVVRTDLQGDGNVSNDVVVAGATATLYRDNGNGQYDSGDTAVGSSVTTDANGKYQFNQVGAGNFFVKVTLPSDLQFRNGEDVKAVSIASDEGDGVVGPTIDGFNSFQMVEASPPPVSTDAGTLADASVLGGERDVYVELTQSTNPISSVTLATSGGNLYVASGPGATGNVKIVWDGTDGNAQNVNPIGLGGLDLTQDNGNTMTGIALTSGADHPNARIMLRVYSDANNWSEYTTVVPESLGGAAVGQATFNFDDVPTDKAGQGANFANVGALELTFEGVTAVDAQVSLIGLVGRATREADFTASPRLSLGDKVWADIDDDGLFENGESPIAGVKLNLYEDTDRNNEYTAGLDQPLGMTTTDANGMYLFTDLFPGKYIVQVDPTNFQSTGPLSGLRSSLGNATAADPDDDVNSDDNGTPRAGAGVVSHAVGLEGRQEPTNDGDNDDNSNRTVDFGFFGFDLVLDKAVEQTTIAPTEQLDYTIKINNDGPSAAEDTTFEDVLPSFATFVSGSTSLSGVGVQHNNGTVTANLGTMQPGDSVTITIIASVDTDATGTLVNTATVSAPKEVDLSNNTDTVSNPLSPRIDLAIDKSADRQSLTPGESFSYTLDIVNNGPSNATGVVISDTLPATGVTFVSASQLPASNDGRNLTFDVGNLPRGGTASVTINVIVDQGFSGTLLNEANVRGNEVETTYLNNDDFVELPVIIEPASLAGHVFVDRNDNGVFEAGERPLGSVVVMLEGTNSSGNVVNRTTTTASDGSYFFGDLDPGKY
ncbi:MAG: SdrD B-like domain-containing protein, partial [Bythopirellula sp.]